MNPAGTTHVQEGDLYMLLYTHDSLEAPGQIAWMTMGPYTSDNDAVVGLLGLVATGAEVTLSRVVRVRLPMLVLPDSLKRIAGEVVTFEDRPDTHPGAGATPPSLPEI